jgi:hypothetical protein
LECKCGFMFSGPGEFRNCEAFITKDGQSGVICPNCAARYISKESLSDESLGEQIFDTFTNAVKKAIEENRAAGIPDEDLMPPPSQ